MDLFKNARLLTETTSGLLAEAEFLSMARIQPHILDGGGDAVKKADLQRQTIGKVVRSNK